MLAELLNDRSDNQLSKDADASQASVLLNVMYNNLLKTYYMEGL